MKHVLHIQNGPHDKPGLFEQALVSAGVAITTMHPWRGEPVPSTLQGFDGLSLGGGGMSAYETEQYPFLKDEMRLVREAAQDDKPVYGMCLGAQIMAAALGARVYANREKEIGFYAIDLLPEAQEDALWRDCDPRFAPMSWHGDTFDLPAGAVRLASSALTPNQLFRAGRALYGFQFHLEVDGPLLTEMIETSREGLTAQGVDADAFLQSAEERLPQVLDTATTVYARWAELLA
ncbi:MAG: gamma-glutamyl-gamma-aminobutyrate hydrolase family protein [Chthoniobacteraceae bacterium]